MTEWMDRFNRLPRREQYLLLVAAGLLVVFLFIQLLWSPVSEERDSLRRQNEVAEKTLASVRELASQYQSLKASGASANVGDINLPSFLNSSVARHQLKLKRLQPSSSGDVQVRFENVPFDRILSWLNELEGDGAVVVKDMSINPGSASGLVNVSARIRRA